jgi:hypothetical protein
MARLQTKKMAMKGRVQTIVWVGGEMKRNARMGRWNTYCLCSCLILRRPCFVTIFDTNNIVQAMTLIVMLLMSKTFRGQKRYVDFPVSRKIFSFFFGITRLGHTCQQVLSQKDCS